MLSWMLIRWPLPYQLLHEVLSEVELARMLLRH